MTEQHRHIWTHHDGQWTCVDCPETTTTCIINKPHDDEHGHPTGLTAQTICPSCLNHEYAILDDITNALGHWQHQPRSLVPAVRYDRDKIGGSRTENDRPTITNPSDILDTLWSWADMWAELRDDTATGDAIPWLKRHTLWAANNPDATAFNDYRSEMRQLRHHARRISGLLPQRQAGPCVHCGATVVRDWADQNWQPNKTGLSDTLRCTGCQLTWNDRDWWMHTNRTTLQLLPTEKPEQLVTLEDAQRVIFPHVPKATWRKWLQRDRERAENGEPQRMPQMGADVRGTALYRVSDLAAHVEHRNSDTRAGRRASA